jgi:circadian clock protein KaiC
MIDEPKVAALRRVETHVPGLDEVLQGGLLRGGLYLVSGTPGAGKTILGNQICFNHVARGGRALYVTLLTESHARMLSSIEPLSFFDSKWLGDSLQYLSGYQILEAEKLPGLLGLLRRVVKDHRASLLVIDGLVTAGSVSSETELKKFLHELQILVELVGCTVLMLTGGIGADAHYAERTMVDGLVTLSMERVGLRAVRQLEVSKFRGSRVLLGQHFFEISDQGIRIHPRTESVLGKRPPPALARRHTLSFGIAGLDQMLSGGLLEASTTLLQGSPGTGKTLLGLSFLAAEPSQGPSLYFGFGESPDRVTSKGSQIGLPLTGRTDLEFVWQPAFEQVADALAERLLKTIQERGVRKLFIDGINGFEDSVIEPGRLTSFFNALTNELRTLGVTTLIAAEGQSIFGPQLDLPVTGISTSVETVLLLRYVELRSQLRRLVSVLKKREGAYDSSLREFSISSGRGIEVAATFESAEAILSGSPRAISGPVAGASRPQGGKEKRLPKRGRS